MAITTVYEIPWNYQDHETQRLAVETFDLDPGQGLAQAGLAISNQTAVIDSEGRLIRLTIELTELPTYVPSGPVKGLFAGRINRGLLTACRAVS